MKGILFVLYLGLFVGGDLFGQIRIHKDSLNSKPVSDENTYFGRFVYYYKGEIFSGICLVKDEFNQLIEYEMKNGRQDGFIKLYYLNGQLKHLFYCREKREKKLIFIE